MSKWKGGLIPQCMAESTAEFAKIYLAIEKLADQCGLEGTRRVGQGEGRGAVGAEGRAVWGMR